MRKNIEKIKTVNVIEYFDNTISQVISFPDTIIGNRLAEETFLAILAEHNMSPEDKEYQLENGIAEDDNGYQVFLVHSS